MVDYVMMKRHTEDFMSLWRCAKPTIAKVQGYSVAGGRRRWKVLKAQCSGATVAGRFRRQMKRVRWWLAWRRNSKLRGQQPNKIRCFGV